MSVQPWEPRLARLEGSFEQIDRRLGDLASSVDTRFAQVDTRLAALEKKVDGLGWKLVTLIVGTWITTMLAVLFHH